MKPWLTTQQLADLFGVTPSRVRAIARERDLTESLSVKFGNTRLWKPSAERKLAPGPVGRPPKP